MVEAEGLRGPRAPAHPAARPFPLCCPRWAPPPAPRHTSPEGAAASVAGPGALPTPALLTRPSSRVIVGAGPKATSRSPHCALNSKRTCRQLTASCASPLTGLVFPRTPSVASFMLINVWWLIVG